MPTEPRFFSPSFYYHIYNRGVEKRTIFTSENDYLHFLQTVDFYLYDQRIGYAQFRRLTEEARRIYATRNPRVPEALRVQIASYCLMSNHFHVLLKPTREDGITRFVSDISNSYTRYFNTKYERVGRLFQNTFKSKEIVSEESLLQVTRYIHLNPSLSSKTNPAGNLKPEDYLYSSYSTWISETHQTHHQTHPKGVLALDLKGIQRWADFAGGAWAYKKFVEAKLGKDPSLGIEDLVIEKALADP